MHFEGLAVIARTLTYLARDINIGQEVHFDAQGAITGTRFAAPALDIERKTARFIAAYLCFGGLGEQFANVIPHSRIGRRVRARSTADRALVHVHDLVKVLGSGDRPMPARNLARPI